MTDDEQRKRLAYADRAETLERNRRRLLPDGHLGECVLSVDDGWRCAIGCREAQLAASSLADGTGRHSRKQATLASTDVVAKDFAARVVARIEADVARENAAAQRVEDAASTDDVALDALERLVCAFHELDRALATMPQQRAWRHAKYVLVQAGRSVKP